jgi:type 1 glutamine amidotransferase
MMRTLVRPLLVIAGLVLLLQPGIRSQTPAAPAPAPAKKVLFLTYTGLAKHTSLPLAEAAMKSWGPAAGFEVTTLEGYKQDQQALDVSAITPEYLNSFDGLMLMTNGNIPFSPVQRRAIVEFVRNGKALIGVHCAALTMYDYPEFGEILGGYYLRSIIPTRQLATGRFGVLKVEDQNHPATKMLGPSWPVQEEFYEYGHEVWDASRPTENISAVGGLHILMPFSRERVHVLLSLDTEHTDLTGIEGMNKGGDYPQSWTRTFGRGRSFYTSLGHRDESWTHNAIFRDHLLGGIRWALGLEG